VIYVVRYGDTLYSIARRFGVSVQAIAQINSISRPSYIQTGQRLIIPRGTCATPTPSANPIVYIVQKGDSLYSIARRYGTTVQALAVANHIANPSLIYVGQRLIIPGTGAPVPPPARIHVVQPGETLYSIARYYGVSVWTIAAANGIADINRIYVGQRLVIPMGAPSGGVVYIVQPGDTMFGIGRRYGLDVWTIARANGITDLDTIYVGQRLVIPIAAPH
jgi:LysM repeat protein